MAIIETKKLTKFYGTVRGIENLELTVNEGDFFGFIGPNGAGKSTTIRTLLGLIRPTAGSASVLGLDCIKNKNEILQSVGYLPSEAAFYRGLTAGEVIVLSAKLRKTDCRAEAKMLCDRLELDTKRRVSELSLGNRKKVGIVCALQHKPSLYILDEPTSGLDPLMQHEIYSILKERNREGATVFLSSHVLSEISRYCQKAAIIRDGAIIACDSVKNLASTGLKRVTLWDAVNFVAPEGAVEVRTEQGTVEFLFEGSATALLAALCPLSFSDFTVTDPSPDEIFMHYYQKEDKT